MNNLKKSRIMKLVIISLIILVYYTIVLGLTIFFTVIQWPDYVSMGICATFALLFIIGPAIFIEYFIRNWKDMVDTI